MVEKEYIEKDLVMDALLNEQYGYCCEDAINAIPVADVVAVVRCRDCARKEICRTSNTWAVAPSDDWFCADGEHKGGDE